MIGPCPPRPIPAGIEIPDAHRRHRGRDPPASCAIAIRRRTACTRWSATTSASTAPERPDRQAHAAAAGSPRVRLDHRRVPGRRCPARRPWSSATTSAWSTTTSRTATGERRHRPTLWTVHGIPQAINTGDTIFSLSRIALHRLTDLGFSDAKVLRLMRLYDETCLALCEGQYIDIWTSEHDEAMSVELYFDMIGRKTAALIAASIEAGAILATDDDDVIARYRGFGWALGLAFQLNDDLLGIWGAEQATGKEPSRPREAQEDAAGPVRPGARWPRGRRAPARAPAVAGAHIGRCRGSGPDPGAFRRPRLHPRPGPPLPRRGARGARRGGRRGAGCPRAARRDHPERDLGVASRGDCGPGASGCRTG